MKKPLAALFFLTCASAYAVDFKKDVRPIFDQKCFACHSVAKGKVKGKVALDTDEKLTAIMGADGHIVPGDPAKSNLLTICKLPSDDSDVMPPDGKNRLTDAEVATLESWIKEGASLKEGGGAPMAPTAAAPAAPAPAAGGMQSWTSNDGKVIQAVNMGLQGDAVKLKMASGQEFVVPLSRLSPESQAQAKAGQ